MNDLKQKIEKINKARNKTLNINTKVSIIFLIISSVTIIFLAIMYGLYLLFFLIPVLAIVLIINTASFIFNAVKYIEPMDEVRNEYKENIVFNVLKEFFEDITYIPEKGIEEKVLRDTQMVYTGDRYYSNDYVKGKYKDISFEFSDILMEDEKRDKDGKEEIETIFGGQWMIFDFNKSFKSKLTISANDFPIFSKLSNIKFEDPDFNDNFIVQAKDEEEAFYILTPNFMEKLKKLKNDLGSYFSLYFVDNKLHIALYNYKDFFELDLYNDVDIEKEKEKIREEIKSIINFIDVLELDNNIFKN